MLKSLNPLLTPELLMTLAKMGHGDVIGVVDRNFPAYTRGRNVIEMPGVGVAAAVEAVLSVMPLESFAVPAVLHMLTDSEATAGLRVLWNQMDGRLVPDQGVLRTGEDGFYARADHAYAIVHTSDPVPYACYLFVKGVVTNQGQATARPG
jgi:L-fucose mutarotase